MSVPQAKFREIVFQLLYSHDVSGSDTDVLVPLLMKQLAVTRKAVKQAQERAAAVEEHLESIDGKIRAACVSYEFERIQVVERSILRLAVYELAYDDTIPPKVAIAESIRLARKFGTPEASSFVNAVLQAIWSSGDADQQAGDVERAIEEKEASEVAASEAAAASGGEVDDDDEPEGDEFQL